MKDLETLLQKRNRLTPILQKLGVNESALSLDALHNLIMLVYADSKASQERQEAITGHLIKIVASLKNRNNNTQSVYITNPQQLPKETRISNLHEIAEGVRGEIAGLIKSAFPKREKMPDSIRVSNLNEIVIPKQRGFNFSRLSEILLNITSAFSNGLKKIIKEIRIKNKDPKDAIPVRLVTPDGKAFYAAQAGKTGYTLLSDSTRLVYGKALSPIVAVDVTDNGAAYYELPANKKFLSIQNAGSSIVAFGEEGLTYADSPKLTPRQFYDFIDCPKSFKVYFRTDSSKTTKIVGFTR